MSNPWVVSDGTIITPAGTQVYLGTTTRAKAIALNPTGNHTAAVLQMGAPQAVTVFNTQTGAVLQTYKPSGTINGSTNGIAYTPDGKYSAVQPGQQLRPGSIVAIASVNATTGLLTDYAHVSVPLPAAPSNAGVGSTNVLSTVTCFPNSPFPVTTGSFCHPCADHGQLCTSLRLDLPYGTSYPIGIAISPDAKTAYAVLDVNNTLAKIDLTAATPWRVRRSASVTSRTASRSRRMARPPTSPTRPAGLLPRSDFQEYSDGTPVVAEYPTGTTATGTVSVVDLATFTVTGSISTGHHPTGMAFWGKYLLVANAYSDSISVIDTAIDKVVRTIDLGLPICVPGESQAGLWRRPELDRRRCQEQHRLRRALQR